MKTKTIFQAFRIAHAGFRDTSRPNSYRARRLRQMDKFETELLCRMDERDSMFVSPDGRRKYRIPQPPAPKPLIIKSW